MCVHIHIDTIVFTSLVVVAVSEARLSDLSTLN